MKRSLLPRAARVGVIIQMRVAERRSVLGLEGGSFFFFGVLRLCGFLGSKPGYALYSSVQLLFLFLLCIHV